ncbi:MAG: MAPEG family protein [Hyphomicrobiaceae bacterium]|nr:MAPEG family protein [Hyphomicrobiaceae bacterium]
MADLLATRISQNLILLPVAAQVLLTCIVLVLMARARKRSMRERDKTAQDLSLATAADWNATARKASNNYNNLLELPVLFYTVTAFALVTRMVDPLMFALAWLFVLARVAHSIVHLTTNVVRWRGSAFLVGFVAVVAMWLLLLWRVAQAGF